jgi:hypothetical protein
MRLYEMPLHELFRSLLAAYAGGASGSGEP